MFLRKTKELGYVSEIPLGITYTKDILPNDRAFEFGIGTAASRMELQLLQEFFDDYNRYDNYDYRSHNVKSTVYLQGRYLFQYNIPIEGMVGKLDWYWGVGAMLKLATVNFTYQNEESPNNISTRQSNRY